MKVKILLCLLFLSIITFSKTMNITYRGPESEKDTRFDYPLALLKEAMEKTKDEYGEYTLIPSVDMNFARASSPQYIETIENFIFETTVREEVEKNLLSVKIPIAKGIYGYRLFLINKNSQHKFDKINTFNDLREIMFGQGATWYDVDILKHSYLNVITAPDYEGLFRMVVRGRFDAFPRGVNEAFHERDERINELPNLAVEENLCIYYPLPRFFYTAKKNTLLTERLEKGLEIMMDDGSFDKIWREYNWQYIEKANLNKRKIFRIDNPFIPDVVPLSNSKYWYYPK